jgi:uncharacterized membrane protein
MDIGVVISTPTSASKAILLQGIGFFKSIVRLTLKLLNVENEIYNVTEGNILFLDQILFGLLMDMTSLSRTVLRSMHALMHTLDILYGFMLGSLTQQL